VLQVETDTYVRRRLEQAIQRVSLGAEQIEASTQEDENSPETSGQDSLAEAVQWVGGLLLHEMEGPIGRASLYASKEISNYSASKTKKEIEILKSVFGGIVQLVKVSKPPRPQQIDLAKLIAEIVSIEIDPSLNPSVYGTKPFLVTSDPDFLRLALVNGLRNAAEAIEQVGSRDQQHPIIVTWGQTDRDYWISVIDHGPGITGSPIPKFEIGKTTKVGHRGFGLAIAKRAMESIGGTVLLQPGTDGGARYELRWERRK
jgi:signal transduction histidine kinase